DDLGDVYHVALLAYAGCTADTQLIASLLGDEIVMGKYVAAIEYDRPAAMFGALLRHVGEGHPPLRRAGILAAALAAGARMAQDGGRAHSAAHCEVAQLLADRLGFGPTVQQTLGQVFERWDGRGRPRGLAGTDLALPVRLLRLAQDVDSVHQI